jgi:hypothetical protein
VCHAASHNFTGPASMSTQLPGMPASTVKMNEAFALAGRSGKALESIQYEVKSARGGVEASGGTDGTGATSSLSGKAIEAVRMKINVPEASTAKEAAETAAQGAEDSEDEKWITFELGKEGSCEGLECVAYFDDGSQMEGSFDADNQVTFKGVSGDKVERVELKFENPEASASFTEQLLKRMGG